MSIKNIIFFFIITIHFGVAIQVHTDLPLLSNIRVPTSCTNTDLPLNFPSLDPPPNTLQTQTERIALQPITRKRKKGNGFEFTCAHEMCQHGNYGTRATLSSVPGIRYHERLVNEHPCMLNSTTCKTCAKIKLLENQIVQKLNTEGLPCRHSLCRAVLVNDRSLHCHENDFSQHIKSKCGDNCEGCKNIQTNTNKANARMEKRQKCAIEICQKIPETQAKKLNNSIIPGLRSLADHLEKNGLKPTPIGPTCSLARNSISNENWFVCNLSENSIMPLAQLQNARNDDFTQNPIKDLTEKEHCTLKDIRWKSLLQGHRKPTNNKVEIKSRIEEAKSMLTHIFNLPYDKCLETLLVNRNQGENLLANLPDLAQSPHTPLNQHTIEALLEFKDRLDITDADWPYVVDFMKLGPNATLHYIRKKRRDLNYQLAPTKTNGQRGHELEIIKMLQYLLTKQPPENADTTIQIKFAFDGGTMTSGKRIQQEQATVQILTDCTLKETKSFSNAHQWMVYLGNEDYDTFQEELKNAMPDIMKLKNEGKILVGDKEYKIEPFLVCDMKCLVKVLGLYEVYHPSSKWKCPWCKVEITKIADFTIPTWPLRDIQEMVEKGNKAPLSKSARSDFASQNQGVKNPPLIEFPLDHVVPCMLHTTMNLTKIMIRQLCEEGDRNPALADALRDQLTALGIKLVPKDLESGKTRTFSEQLKKSRLQRPQYLAIVENYSKLIETYKIYSKQDAKYKDGVEIIWKQFYTLLSVASQEKIDIKEEQWLKNARIFGTNFVTLYNREDVTPYIHVFIYHNGFYLEKYGSLEIFANYAIEGRVRYNKKTIATATNGFSNINAKENITFQILTKSWRDDIHRIEGTDNPTLYKQYQKESWATKSLQKAGNLEEDFESVCVNTQDTNAENIVVEQATNNTVSPQDERKNELRGLTVPQLKDLLRQNKLMISGTKEVLISRIIGHEFRI